MNLITLCVFILLSVAGSTWARSTEEKVKEKIDEASDGLKSAVDRFGDNLMALQDYLDHYHWKGLIQDEASSGAATLKHLQLNNHSRATVVKPGERIEGSVTCVIDKNKCDSLKMYRVVLGLKGEGAQTTVGNDFGISAGETREKFTLIAPSKPGIYELRFKLVQSFFEEPALESWKDPAGHEPTAASTIGLVVVK